jgi:hypothetical protein
VYKSGCLIYTSHLLGEDLRGESSGYKATGERAVILSNYNSPEGLHDLASNTDMIDALKINDAEWIALHSIKLPYKVDMDGYIQLLLTIRAIK